ncbi:MAG: hypothetical protein RL588_1742 [Pseudomonadota bacterium]|jgi:hypothetical protein
MALFRNLILAAAVASAASPLAAQAAQAAKPAKAPAPAAAPALDADAAAALDRMGAYLRTLKSFDIHVESSSDTILNNGQRIQTERTVDYAVETPNRLAARLEGRRGVINTLYDGATFTVAGDDYYAQAPMTGSISSLLSKAYTAYGIDFPLQDLFRWGDPSSVTARPTEGFRVGPARVGGVMTDHYAFRQPGVDFQVWIEQGDKPLPRKMVITSLTDAAQPQYTALISWNLSPRHADGQFTFKPGPGAKKIRFRDEPAAK